MHIVFLSPEYVRSGKPEGGLANYLRKVGIALTERGHDVSILVLSDKNAIWHDKLIKIYELKKNSLARMTSILNLPYFINQIIFSKDMARTVWEIHKDYPIDIIQATSYLAPGYCLLQNNRIPLVCRVSSYTPLIRSAYGRKRDFSDYLSDWLEIRQIIDADASYVMSTSVARDFERIEGHKLHVIRHPIESIDDMEMDSSFYSDHLLNKKYLLFFGTLSRIKGVDLIAEALPNILRQHEDLHFVFIGRDDGLPSGKKAYDYVIDLNQDSRSRLHYYPPLPKSKLYPIITNSIGVVMPSRADTYPNACLEAQTLGLPVVGTYDSSLDEMIVDGQTGFLAENANVSSLCESIERLLSQSSEQREEMHKRISKHVDAMLDEDRVGQLINFYKYIIANYSKKH